MVVSFAVSTVVTPTVISRGSGKTLQGLGSAPAGPSASGPTSQHMTSAYVDAAKAPQLEEEPCAGASTTAGSAGTCAGPTTAAKQQQAFSPTAVGALATVAVSQQSSDPATPPGDGASSAAASSSGGSRERRKQRSGELPSSPASEPSCSDASAAELQQDVAAAVQQHAAAQQQQRRRAVDVAALVERLKQRPMTGQVVAWGWGEAAAVSCVRRTLPAQLFSALWPATEACVMRMMPQDVLEMLEAWLTLMQQCPRHFRLAKSVLEGLATYALPAAVKRMSEKQLAQLAGLARDIALHRSDADMQMVSGPTRGASARDLMQTVFALAAAEAAWRCNNPTRYVSPETVSAIITAAPAWSWRVVRHRDSQPLAALKLATAAALGELAAHSPRDLSPSAFRKLRICGSSSSTDRGAPSSGGTTPRQLST